MFDFHALLSAEGLVSLVSLTAMEIVLGIDNVVLHLDPVAEAAAAQQPRRAGWASALALVLRLGLLFAISWMMGLTQPLFTVLGKSSRGAT